MRVEDCERLARHCAIGHEVGTLRLATGEADRVHSERGGRSGAGTRRAGRIDARRDDESGEESHQKERSDCFATRTHAEPPYDGIGSRRCRRDWVTRQTGTTLWLSSERQSHSIVDMVLFMTYVMSGPAVVAHLLVEIATSLERELPDIGSRQIIRSVQAAHRVARVLLPDVASYAAAVGRLARSNVSDIS